MKLFIERSKVHDNTMSFKRKAIIPENGSICWDKGPDSNLAIMVGSYDATEYSQAHYIPGLADILQNIRIHFNGKPFDIERLITGDGVKDEGLTFTAIDEDDIWSLHVAATHKHPHGRISFDEKATEPYKALAKFVNTFILVRFDTDQIFSPYRIPFRDVRLKDDTTFYLNTFGNFIPEFTGLKVIDPDTYVIDDEVVPLKALKQHDRFMELVLRSVFMSADKGEPIVVISPFGMEKDRDVFSNLKLGANDIYLCTV